MGYRVQTMRSSFFIDRRRLSDCLSAIKSLAGQETVQDPNNAHFSWVRTEHFLAAKTVAVALLAWRWDAVEANDGAIAGINFVGEKLGDDKLLLDTIAPFVRAGSFIIMHGEDGETWRWWFDGERCVEQLARLVFDEDAP